jgi:hypothetical protein
VGEDHPAWLSMLARLGEPQSDCAGGSGVVVSGELLRSTTTADAA